MARVVCLVILISIFYTPIPAKTSLPLTLTPQNLGKLSDPLISVASLDKDDKFKGHPRQGPGGPGPEDDDDSDEDDDDNDDADDDSSPSCSKPTNCDCGGIVNMTGFGNATIQYRGGSYKNNERCVWTIVPEGTVTLNGLVVLFERLDFGNDKDGLIFYTWDGRDSFNGTKITQGDKGKILMFNVQYAFLYFSSDGATNGKGFKATILGMPGDSRSSSGEKRHSVFFNGTKCPKEIMYPYPPFSSYEYPYNGKASWVLQGKYDDNTQLKMQFMDTYTQTDYIKVYQLPPYGTSDKTFVMEGSYSGRNPSVTTTTSKDPRIVLFSSHGSGSGRGFHLTWEQIYE